MQTNVDQVEPSRETSRNSDPYRKLITRQQQNLAKQDFILRSFAEWSHFYAHQCRDWTRN